MIDVSENPKAIQAFRAPWRKFARPMKPERLMLLIAGAVGAWGVYHAWGAYWNFRVAGEQELNPWRGVIVLACVAGFLGFWALMLLSRRRRLEREADEQPRP